MLGQDDQVAKVLIFYFPQFHHFCAGELVYQTANATFIVAVNGSIKATVLLSLFQVHVGAIFVWAGQYLSADRGSQTKTVSLTNIPYTLHCLLADCCSLFNIGCVIAICPF